MEMPGPSPLYWIHCYNCLESYVKKQYRFALCACNHIACEKCLKKSFEKPGCVICPECNRSVACKQIGNNMPSHIKELFHPEPWKDGLPFLKIIAFQKKHVDHFFQEMQKIKSKLVTGKADLENVRNETKKMYFKRQNLVKQTKRNKSRIRQILAEKAEWAARSEVEQNQVVERNYLATKDSGIDSNSFYDASSIAQSRLPVIRSDESLMDFENNQRNNFNSFVL